MKIAFLIQDLFQQGAQYVTALMVRGFVAKGYDVDLIVSKVHQDLLAQGDIKPFEIPKKANVIILPNRRAKNNVKAIRDYLVENAPNAIVAMSTNYNFALALAALRLPRRIRKKCIISYVEHSSLAGIDINTMLPGRRPRLLSKQWFIGKLFNHCFDVIMGVSEGTSRAIEYTMRRKVGSVVPVYNPVIDDIFKIKIESNPKHLWIVDKTHPTIVAAAAHSEFKNHMCLFNAIKLANETIPVRLILFGKGELTDSYKQWIKDNEMEERISIAGHTDNLPAEIKGADAFVVSSNIESFSVVLVEAMAVGAPVISTSCPFGPPELLQGGKYGVLVPVNDSESLANAIIEQVRNPRPSAPREAWEKFTVENIVEAYEKALGISINN